MLPNVSGKVFDLRPCWTADWDILYRLVVLSNASEGCLGDVVVGRLRLMSVMSVRVRLSRGEV